MIEQKSEYLCFSSNVQPGKSCAFDCGMIFFTPTGGIIPQGIGENVFVSVPREDNAISGNLPRATVCQLYLLYRDLLELVVEFYMYHFAWVDQREK